MTILTLPGCAPVPLAHYLKALGILRLVAEQADSAAAGCWQRDAFVLHSSLDHDALLDFFLHRYQPTPILAPWNAGSGFYYQEEKLKAKDPVTGKKIKTGVRNQPTAATCIVDAILNSSSLRFAGYRSAISAAKTIIQRRELSEAPDGDGKNELISELRGQWPDAVVSWLDCVTILVNADAPTTAFKATFPPLLGTGANDGNADFSSNFMQRLCEVLSGAEPPPPADLAKSKLSLDAAIFGGTVVGSRTKAAIGQFFPGSAGGPNNCAGFSGDSFVNPWDFILMIEGALLFAAAAVRRLEAGQEGALAYPFSVRPTAAGYASSAGEDEASGRPELWLPLWENPVALTELQAVFGEARSQVGSRAARNGIDFTRAAVTLGVDRGLSSFQRYGFCQRNGKNYFATPLERVVVRRNARADLLGEVDTWLTRLRGKAGPTAKQPPASVARALNQLEVRILELCKQNDDARLQAVLIALGAAERAVARSLRWATETAFLRPLQGLSLRWLADADTGSREFRLAAALASLTGSFGDDWLALRCHLEPVETLRRGQFKWADTATNDVQWSQAPLPDVLNAIFTRRLIRAEKAGTGGLPEIARCYATVADITAFIEGETDDALLTDLLWGLSLLDWSAVKTEDVPWMNDCRSRRKEALTGVAAERSLRPSSLTEEDATPPSLYALLKLCFLPQRPNEDPIPLVPAIHHRASAGDGAAASCLPRADCAPPAFRLPCGKSPCAAKSSNAPPPPCSFHSPRVSGLISARPSSGLRSCLPLECP